MPAFNGIKGQAGGKTDFCGVKLSRNKGIDCLTGLPAREQNRCVITGSSLEAHPLAGRNHAKLMKLAVPLGRQRMVCEPIACPDVRHSLLDGSVDVFSSVGPPSRYACRLLQGRNAPDAVSHG